MSEHRATIRWERRTEGFGYEEYDRDHTWDLGGGASVQASAAPKYRGTAERIDPEEAFVASLSSCHMLTFLAIASQRGFVVDSYVDEAVGTMGPNAERRLAVTQVVLRPVITFGGDERPSPEDLARMHHESHEQCFLANSVKTTVTVEAPESTAAS